MRDLLISLKKDYLKDALVRSIFRNSSIILCGNTTSSALNLVSLMILAKQLGPATFGLLVLAQAYTLILNDIFNVQTWESLVKYAAGQLNDQNTGNIIKFNTLLDIGSALIAFCFALLLVKPVVGSLGWDPSIINLIYFYCMIIPFRLTSLVIGIPRLYNKFLEIAQIQVAIAALKLSCICLIMKTSNEFFHYAAVYIGADILINIVTSIYSLFLLKHQVERGWWNRPLSINRNQVVFIWWTNLRTVIRIPVRYFDVIAIGAIMPISTVGIYKVFKEIAGVLNKFSDPINQSIFPEFSKLIGANNIRESIITAKKSIFLLACAGTAIIIPLFLYAKPVIAKFIGVAFVSQIGALYFLLALMGISFVLVPINSLFVAAGFAKSGFYIVLFTNAIYLLAVLLLGNIIGIYGVVAAYGIQMVINQGMKLYLMQKYPDDWSTVVR